MDSFAFIIHPIDPKRDVSRKYPLLGKILNEQAIDFLCRFWPPVKLSHVTGARSVATNKEIEGWLIAVPYTPQRMLSLPTREVYRKIIATGHVAQSLGAKILGLGAYTSVVGDGGITIARELDIPVTTGDSYTAAAAVRSLWKAAEMMDIDPACATLAVVGASGAIGGVVAQLAAPQVARIILMGRRLPRLEEVAEKTRTAGCRDVDVSTDLGRLREAELVLTVTSAGGNLIQPEHLRSGAVVCDVSRPRDVSHTVAQARPDVLFFDGGLLRVPGPVQFGFDYGLPPDMTYGCMAEVMTLTFEGRFEDYTLGKDLHIERVQEIERLGSYHGFELAALRSFEHKLDEAIIDRIKASIRS